MGEFQPNVKSEMYVLLLFMEEGQTVGNLCIWKVCNKFIGNQYMESGGEGGEGGRREEGGRETWKMQLNSRSGTLHNQSHLQRPFFSVS